MRPVPARLLATFLVLAACGDPTDDGPPSLRTPVTLGSALPGPFDLEVDADYVYFLTDLWSDGTESSSLQRLPKDGGQAELLASGFTWPNFLSIDDTHAYFVADYQVLRVPLAGGPIETVVPGSASATNPVALAVDDTSVYYADRVAQTIVRRDKQTGATETLVHGDTQLGDLHALHVRGGQLYYADRFSLHVISVDGPPDSGQTLVADTGTYPTCVAASDDGLWWCGRVDDLGDHGYLGHLPAGATTFERLGEGKAMPRSVVPAGRYVFAAVNEVIDGRTWGDASVVRVDETDGASGALLEGGPLGDLAVDDDHVYVLSTLDGTIGRIPRR